MIDDFRAEYRRYRAISERALAQMPDAALNRVPAPEANSAAMIVRHRGQITTYLRPMGSTVPQIYGPSGDEP